MYRIDGFVQELVVLISNPNSAPVDFSKLQLDYVDLYMVHWPIQLKKGSKMPPKEADFLPLDLRSSWAALEQCVERGLTKAIGVSNFSVAVLKDLMSFAKIPPVVNQVNTFEPNPSVNVAFSRILLFIMPHLSLEVTVLLAGLTKVITQNPFCAV